MRSTASTEFICINSKGLAVFNSGLTFTRADVETALKNLRNQDSTKYPIVLKQIPAFEKALASFKPQRSSWKILPLTLDEAKRYLYGGQTRAGGPPLLVRAYQEDKCAYDISSSKLTVPNHQCSHKKGFGPEGLYCKIHARNFK
jgi:hypothetical protein